MTHVKLTQTAQAARAIWHALYHTAAADVQLLQAAEDVWLSELLNVTDIKFTQTAQVVQALWQMLFPMRLVMSACQLVLCEAFIYR